MEEEERIEDEEDENNSKVPIWGSPIGFILHEKKKNRTEGLMPRPSLLHPTPQRE